MNFFQGRSAGRVRQSVFFPEKTEKGRRGAKKKRQPPERGGEIVIQQASDDCQAVLLHCRCDANIHSSFSSPTVSSSSSSFLLHFSSPSSSYYFLVLSLSSFFCPFLHFRPLSLFFFRALCPPTSPSPPLLLLSPSLSALSGDEWVE